MRFSVASYRRRMGSDVEELFGVYDTDDDNGDRDSNSWRRRSHTYTHHTAHSGKILESPVSRRAFKAARYVQRMRSQSHAYSSDVRESDCEDVNEKSGSSNKLGISVGVTSSSNCESAGDLATGLTSSTDTDSNIAPTLSSASPKANISPGRRGKHRSQSDCSDRSSSESSGKNSFCSQSSFDPSGMSEALCVPSPPPPPRRPLLRQTPSARQLLSTQKKKKNPMLSRLTSFEDDTHITIAIEDSHTDTDIAMHQIYAEDRDMDNNYNNGDVIHGMGKKTSGIFTPLTKQFSAVWGLRKQPLSGLPGPDDELVEEFCQDNPVTMGSHGSSNHEEEVLVSYEDSYSPSLGSGSGEPHTAKGEH